MVTAQEAAENLVKASRLGNIDLFVPDMYAEFQGDKWEIDKKASECIERDVVWYIGVCRTFPFITCGKTDKTWKIRTIFKVKKDDT